MSDHRSQLAGLERDGLQRIPEIGIACCVAMEPELDLDADDWTVWVISCASCCAHLGYLIDRRPSPCAAHTLQMGPHHVDSCAYYDTEFEEADRG